MCFFYDGQNYFLLFLVFSLFVCFSVWVFFREHSRITEQQGKGVGIPLTPLYHFHPLHIHLDISRAITAASSPLHIAHFRYTVNWEVPSPKHPHFITFLFFVTIKLSLNSLHTNIFCEHRNISWFHRTLQQNWRKLHRNIFHRKYFHRKF